MAWGADSRVVQPKWCGSVSMVGTSLLDARSECGARIPTWDSQD